MGPEIPPRFPGDRGSGCARGLSFPCVSAHNASLSFVRIDFDPSIVFPFICVYLYLLRGETLPGGNCAIVVTEMGLYYAIIMGF